MPDAVLPHDPAAACVSGRLLDVFGHASAEAPARASYPGRLRTCVGRSAGPEYPGRLPTKCGTRTRPCVIPGTSSGMCRQTYPPVRHTRDVFGHVSADVPARASYPGRLRACVGRRTRPCVIPGTSSGMCRQKHPPVRHTRDVFGHVSAEAPARASYPGSLRACVGRSTGPCVIPGPSVDQMRHTHPAARVPILARRADIRACRPPLHGNGASIWFWAPGSGTMYRLLDAR
jgi:hypothetical protein